MNELATRVPAQLELLVGARKLVETSVSENTGQACSGVPPRFYATDLEQSGAGTAAYLTGLFEEGRSHIRQGSVLICKPATDL